MLAWLIIDARPFSLSNSRRFREFMADFGYIPPSTRQLRRYTFLLVNGVNAMIRSKVKQLEFVSAAIDEWSSATLVPFLSICYQGFTNDMELLTFEDLVPFPAPHTAERYRMVIKQCIQDRAPSSNITLSVHWHLMDDVLDRMRANQLLAMVMHCGALPISSNSLSMTC